MKKCIVVGVLLEPAICICYLKWLFLNISQNSQENTCVGIPEGLQLYYKETPTQGFSCEIEKCLKTCFFTIHLWWLLLSFKIPKTISTTDVLTQIVFWYSNSLHRLNMLALCLIHLIFLLLLIISLKLFY